MIGRYRVVVISKTVYVCGTSEVGPRKVNISMCNCICWKSPGAMAPYRHEGGNGSGDTELGTEPQLSIHRMHMCDTLESCFAMIPTNCDPQGMKIYTL